MPRYLTLFIALTLLIQAPAYGMRPIGTAEGAGLEELSRELGGGLEEDEELVLRVRQSAKQVRQWANEAERVIGYLSGRRARGHVPDWYSFMGLLKKAAQVEEETPWGQPGGELLQQALEELRYFLDFLATLKMQMLLVRNLELHWKPGQQISEEAAADLEELYIQEAGLRLKRKPPRTSCTSGRCGTSRRRRS